MRRESSSSIKVGFHSQTPINVPNRINTIVKLSSIDLAARYRKMSFTSTFSPEVHREKTASSSSGSDSPNRLYIQPRHSNPVTPDYPGKDLIFAKHLRTSNAHHQRNHPLEVSPRVSPDTVSATRSPPYGGLEPRPAGTSEQRQGLLPPIPISPNSTRAQSHHVPESPGGTSSTGTRLNKFVRRLHDMLQAEKDSGVVDWRRGLLVLHSTDAFAKNLLPKYFNTRNFKTFRRQLNYYGFVHVRSFSATGSSTTALWVNRDLANEGTEDISSVLKLKRVEPCDTAKTAEGRRQRKEDAIFTVEEDIGVSAKTLQLEQIRSMALGSDDMEHPHSRFRASRGKAHDPLLPSEVRFVSDSSASTFHDYDSTMANEADDPDSASAANVLLMLSRA